MKIGLIGVVLLILVSATAAAQDDPVCIGAGDPAGRYHAFAEALAERLEHAPCVVETAGSLENLEGLADGRFELAVVQSDLAHHQYFGDFGFERWREFRAIAPLFPEYIQIIVRDEPGAPRLLGDLRGRTVGIGEEGSGSALNAIDVMEEAGLIPQVDLAVVNAAIAANLDALRAGEIDALVLTSAADFLADNDGLVRLPPPASLVNALSSARPYYEPAVFRADAGDYPTLAVRAFLLTGPEARPAAVTDALESLLDAWPQFSQTYPGMRSPDAFLQATPFPMHPAARSVLVAAGHADPEPAYAVWIAASAALLMISLAAMFAQTNYDRTGARRERRGRWAWLQVAVDAWARPSPWIVGFSVFMLSLLVSLMVLRSVEGAHARAFNLDNPFVDFTLSEGFMWMLTYVSSGFTENDAFPMTVPGRVIVAALALIGVTGPIGAIIVLVSLWSRRRADAEAGTAPKLRWKDHILVCGWNEKLDGVVFALTSHDAELKERVCIVAQSGEASPVAGDRFDGSRVKYRRGDSAERETLALANAEKARHAIILADYGRRESGNVGAILTAMHLKRLNPAMTVSAELAFSQNADHFAAFGCRTLITPDVFVAKAAALSTIHPLIIDFVFEALTYDVFDEIYSVDAEALAARNLDVKEGMALSRLEAVLAARGANLVGIVEHRERRDAVYEAEISEFSPVRPLLSAEAMKRPLKAGDAVLYSAQKRAAAFHTPKRSLAAAASAVTADQLAFSRPHGTRILLYASKSHLERLEANLRAYHRDPVIHAIAIEEEAFLTRERLLACLPESVAFDHAIIMAAADARHSATTSDAVRAIDAGTLLTAKLIRQHGEAMGWRCTITAEALSASDRAAFEADAHGTGGPADVVIPSSTLVERFLVKEASDGNALLDYLIAVMNMRDGTHLFAHEVTTGDPLEGQGYAGLIGTRVEGLRLVGWLPVSKRSELRNRTGDFGYHFRTAFNDQIKQMTVQPGDVLIFVACFDQLEQTQ